MPFHRDENYAADVGGLFGRYLTTFVSVPSGQVRAELFRMNGGIIAHICFPTGAGASDVTDPNVSQLREYARREGVADHFRLVMS